MDFGYSATQKMLRRELGEFVEEHCIGENLEWDDEDNFPQDVYDELVEMDLMAMDLPEEAGGLDLDPLTVGMVYEQLGRGDVGLAATVMTQNLVNKILSDYGSDVHVDIATENAAGENFLAFALTEPGQGSDAQNLEMTAEHSDEGWTLNGEKTAITCATLADYALVYARDAETGDIRIFVPSLHHDDVDVVPYDGMGVRVSGWGQIHFDDATFDEDVRLSNEAGFKSAMEKFNRTRIWIGLYCLGAAQQTLDETTQYLTERPAFGKTVAHFEGPQFQVAEMQTRIEAARLKAYHGLWRAREGMDNAKDAAMVKWLGPAVSADAIHQCLVLHGHYGYSTDFGIEGRLRDVIGLEIGDGTPQIQKLIVAREIFGREYLPY